MKRCLIALCLFASTLVAQQRPEAGTSGPGAPLTLSPVPDCVRFKQYVDVLTGNTYAAQGFNPCTWVAAGGSGGTVSGQTPASIPLATGATAITKPSPLSVDDVNTPTKVTSTVGLVAPTLKGTHSRDIDITAPPYNAVCDGTTDDRAAIQSVLDAIYDGGYAQSAVFPAASCKIASPLSYRGESFHGVSMAQSIIIGPTAASGDASVFAAPDPADSPTRHCCAAGGHVHDISITLDGASDPNGSTTWAAKGRGAGQGTIFANNIAQWSGQTIVGPVSATDTVIGLASTTNLAAYLATPGNYHSGYAPWGWVQIDSEFLTYHGIVSGFVLSAAANASAGNTIYTGTFPMGVSNALAGDSVTISGFTTGANNGTFTVVSNTSGSLTVNNASGVAETHAGASSCPNNAAYCLLDAGRAQKFAGTTTTAATHSNGAAITPVNPLAPADTTDWLPAFTVGAGAFVFPARDGSHYASSLTHYFIDHIRVNNINGGTTSQNTAAFYFQALPYTLNMSGIYTNANYGIVAAFQATNQDVPFNQSASSDGNSFRNLDFNSVHPFMWTLGSNTGLTESIFYAGSAQNQQAVGFTTLPYTCHVTSCGLETTALYWVVHGLYQEPNVGANWTAYPPFANISGQFHRFQGGSGLSQSSGNGHGQYPLVFDASFSQILNVSMGPCGIGNPAVTFYGAVNEMNYFGGPDNTCINDQGFANRIQMIYNYSNQHINMNATAPVPNLLTAEWMNFGSNYFNSVRDLYVVPDQMGMTDHPIATNGFIATDSTSPTGKYYDLPSATGANIGTGFVRPLWVKGTVVPAQKVTFHINAKAIGGTTVCNIHLFTPGTSIEHETTFTTSYADQSWTVDISTLNAGSVQWNTTDPTRSSVTTCNPATEVKVAYYGIAPGLSTGSLTDWTNASVANGNVPVWNSTTLKWTPGVALSNPLAVTFTDTSASGNAGTAGSVVVTSAKPIIALSQTGAGTDQKTWDFIANSTPNLQLRSISDDNTTSTTAMQIDRGTAKAITDVLFPETVIGSAAVAASPTTPGAFFANSTRPAYVYAATGQGTDQKFWYTEVNALAWKLETSNDAFTSSVSVITVNRGTGTAVGTIVFGGTGVGLPSGSTVNSVAITGTVISGTSAMGTTAITAGTCATVVTTAATGALTTDTIAWAFNAAPSTGYTAGLNVLAYPTAGNVNFLVCNATAGSLTPAAATLNWRITR